MKKQYQLNEYDQKLCNLISKKSAPRHIGYSNIQIHNFDWGVRKYKKDINVLFTVNPEMIKLTDLGYDDEWSKKNNVVIEQFCVKLNLEQAQTLSDSLQDKIKKLRGKSNE